VLRTYAHLLRDGWVRTLMIAVFLEGALFYGAFAYAGAYLKARFALPYLTIGAVLACYGLGGLAYSLLVRRLRAVLSERGFVELAAMILLASLEALALVPLWQAAIPLFAAIGFGFYLLHNTLQTRATEMAPQSRGMGISLFALGLFIGQAGGVPANGLLIDAVGYRWTFAADGILLAALACWFSGRLRARNAAG
jgi:predicted MFS family arabinose efflux permease